MDAVQQLAPTVGIQSACDALGVARASFYRQPVFGPALPVPVILRPAPARALCAEERKTVRALLNSARFQDCAPASVQATLLDEGQYLCSTRTMYRVLAQDGGTRERRDHLTHPEYKKPELLATAPNRLWSWDITKLRGPAKWTYFYLYVILDVFSRYVVGWMIAPREGAALASHSSRKLAKSRSFYRTSSSFTPTADLPCAASPWRFCWPISASPRPTAGPTLPTTIRFQKASSAP